MTFCLNFTRCTLKKTHFDAFLFGDSSYKFLFERKMRIVDFEGDLDLNFDPPAC